MPPLEVEPDGQFLPLGVIEVADDSQGVLGQAEFLDGPPSLVAVDQDVLGGDQEGLEDAPVPDRVAELGLFNGRERGNMGAAVSLIGGDLLVV